MRSVRMSQILTLALAPLLATPSQAGLIITGPGDVNITNNDTDFDAAFVDLVTAPTLAAGNYQATTFEYQFSQAQATIGGRVQPFLAIDTSNNQTSFTVVALGDFVNFSGTTPYTSVAFGGSPNFTLSTSRRLYGGYYWDGSSGQRDPIGFVQNTGSTFILQAGANAPVLGSPLSGGSPDENGAFARTYDFRVRADVQPVPEPASAGLLSVGLCLLAYLRRRCGRVA